MRVASWCIPLVALATSASAQPTADIGRVEQALRDPATAQRLERTLDSLTDALLDLKIAGVEAALQGRSPTTSEKALTIRDRERAKGRNPDELRAQIRAAGPAIAQSMNALADALPAMTKALDDVQRVVDKAAANMPDPTYPRR